MKEVTMIFATQVFVYCPHCGEKVDGFMSDPRGDETDCDYCQKKFKLHPDADVEIQP